MKWLGSLLEARRELVFPLKRLCGSFGGLTPAEREAQSLDDGYLGSYYLADERAVELFDGVRYSREHGAWVARFVPTRRGATKLAHSDATYAEVLDFARILHGSRVKPSQSYRALVALDDRFDRACAALFARGAHREELARAMRSLIASSRS